MVTMPLFNKFSYITIGLLLLVFLVTLPSLGTDYRPSLVFREDWQETPPATPVTQEQVSNQDLILNLYGSGANSIKKSHHEQPIDDPYYIWSGLASNNWALTLKHKKFRLDLTGYAKIIWRSKQSGFRELRIILKLEDGTWLISNVSDGASKDWRITEFNLMDIQWYKLNIDSITEQSLVRKPDLTQVDELGFTDLMRGGKTLACSRLDWIEVYGNPVQR
jgi:hypothetical protein